MADNDRQHGNGDYLVGGEAQAQPQSQPQPLPQSQQRPQSSQQPQQQRLTREQYQQQYEQYQRQQYQQRQPQRQAQGQVPQNAPVQGGFVPASQNQHRGSRLGQAQGQPQGANAYAQYARAGASYSAAQQGMSTGKKVGIAVLVIALIAAVAVGGFFIVKEMRKAQVNADLHDMDKETMQAIDAQLTGSTSFDEPFTMLLLGTDERDWDPDVEGARADTVILVRVDAPNKHVSMVSIPRDTMVQLPGVGTAKINAAYYYGGPAGVISAVKDLTGVDIDHYACVNFAGLEGLVDAIGGIDVHVDERIDNYKAGLVVIEEGDQHLNGYEALTLARNRDYADGDYTRQVNQRKVIMGIVERVMNTPAAELAGIVQASTNFITTDSAIDFDWIYSLADIVRHLDVRENPLEVKSTTLPSSPAYIGEVSYVIADTAGMNELMQTFLAGGDVSQPLTQSSIGTDIANAGGAYGPPSGGDEGYYSEEEYYYDDEGEGSDEE